AWIGEFSAHGGKLGCHSIRLEIDLLQAVKIGDANHAYLWAQGGREPFHALTASADHGGRFRECVPETRPPRIIVNARASVQRPIFLPLCSGVRCANTACQRVKPLCDGWLD